MPMMRFILISFVIHVMVFSTFMWKSDFDAPPGKPGAVRVTLQQSGGGQPSAPSVPAPTPSAKKKVSVKPQPKPEVKTTTAKPTTVSTPTAAPSAAPGASSSNNTLVVGQSAGESSGGGGKGGRNLSRDAILITSSVEVPSLTDDAIDAGLQGNIKVEVFVDKQGQVQDIELSRTVGYGMDALLKRAARSAKFIPRKDKRGRPQAGWSFILFNLQLP